MDFFTAQSEAQRKTRWLVFWFVMAAMGVIAVFYLSVRLCAIYIEPIFEFVEARQHLSFISIAVIACALFATFWTLRAEDDTSDSPTELLYAEYLAFSTLALLAILALLFLIAIALIIVGYEIVQAFLMHGGSNIQFPPISSLWNEKWFLWMFLLVGGIIATASLRKIREISRHGGRLIAEQLGGRIIPRNTQDPAERRCLNVIDEMSIAAGIPAPVAFVLDKESGLNAFTAGLSAQDNVIAVTRGLLKTMNRDELQGVIAHEISHIVNGDSYLNLKMIGILHGIFAFTLAGRKLVYHKTEGFVGKREVFLPITIPFGFFLCVIGFIGLFFGRLIQSTVSREREYLADASAVQFTRYSFGLVSALRKLQTSGSQIRHPHAAIVSHLFLLNRQLRFDFSRHAPYGPKWQI
ncbi:MAG: M48 family metalloprotease [Betaproteobacteria bacterium]|nr:M48 family metalloprotease [Betaproteobacteria bacterium]